ncbi:amidohydrolase [Vibrio sp. M60_M31a]
MIEEIVKYNEVFTAWRRDIHQHPELGFQEQRTAALVTEKLTEWGFDEVHTGIAKTGVVGVLKGKHPSSDSIGLRADMDALQMSECNTFSHASCHHGKMHGCGHDGHTAILLATAWYLAQHRNFSGTVYFIFQPAEEGLAGAKAMIDDGTFRALFRVNVMGYTICRVFPRAKFGYERARFWQSSDRFSIEISGKGGHAALPQNVIDPTLIVSTIITSAQSIVSKSISPLDSAVVSFTDLHAGSGTFNVIPDKATMMGCIRNFRTIS